MEIFDILFTTASGIVSVILSCVFFALQLRYFKDTGRFRKKFECFFKKRAEYFSVTHTEEGSQYPQITAVGEKDSDLNDLIGEINTYLYKTKGTSDYEFIRNKVERKLNMRYDQSTVHLTFPTYLGLMGTFVGVFFGIFMFLVGFEGDEVTDSSIKNLLTGVLVSMSTSFLGLLLTTVNQHRAGEARKKIEDDKDEFYDFIQTDVTKTASASLVSAISRLHDTVDKFEPAFNKVIDRFQTTFDNCTRAFGDNFEKNVEAVAGAVEVMGRNMDKINENVSLQRELVSALKGEELVRGMEKYVEAADRFAGITRSLDKFEEARRMMLAAAQESINVQNAYSESLKMPKEVAVRINRILDRISTFEDSVNQLGGRLNQRDILGNDVVEALRDQLNGIAKKGRIADKYLGVADGKLEDLYRRQTETIDKMNEGYRQAIENHVRGFETMLGDYAKELKEQHDQLRETLRAQLNAEDVRKDFSNLSKLDGILGKLREMSDAAVKYKELESVLTGMKTEIKTELENVTRAVEKKSSRWF